MKTVKQVLDHKGYQIHSVAPGTTVYEALQKMAQEGIGALVVLDDQELAGIVSERDYARKVILKGRHSRDTPVRDIMTKNVICVGSDRGIDASMSIMIDKHVRHLVVRDDSRITGVISIGDVVKAIIDDQQFTIEQLEHYISGRG
ncbi:MAG: CBS domain-containing protein [Myxococcales bacterium]|jgi:CBS domain-containing protein|nr:CBS domain-containing protein [Myxococcales bacterium]